MNSSGLALSPSLYDPDNRVLTANIAGGVAKSYTYDAIGNIKTKSDVGTYSYPASGSGSVRPHAVSSIAGTVNNGPGSGGVVTNPSYGYDANGNMTSGGGRSMSYTAFNVPATIANASTTQTFAFDPEHNRISQVETSSLAGAAAGTTLYLNGGGILCERFTNASTGVVTWRNYIVADGETKALVNQTANTAGPNWGAFNWEMAGQPGARNWTSSITATATLYLHSDHLGSIAAITNSSAALSEQDAYDPWGKRRNLNGTDDTLDALTSQTTRGYTDQEELTDVALLHLNGRVYDPQLGKLTSGDPLVSQPYGTQGWNRYAYVLNNPLNTVDPSGFDFVSTYCYTPPTPSADIDDNDIVVYAAPQPVCTTTSFSTPFNAGPGVGGGGNYGKGTAPKCAPNSDCTEVYPGPKKFVTSYVPIQYAYDPFSLLGGIGLQQANRPKACSVGKYQQARQFVQANAAAAQQIASQLNTAPGNILGLAANESGYGTGFLITAGTNNYFSLTAGPAFGGTIGTYQNGSYTYGVYPAPGFLTSGQSFANSYFGRRVNGISDPLAFAQSLNASSSFNSEKLATPYDQAIADTIGLVNTLLSCTGQ